MVDKTEDPESKENKSYKGEWKSRAQELLDKGLLDSNQKESINKMIDSPDDENFAVAREVVKYKVSEKLVEGLNDGQKTAFDQIIDFLRDPQQDAFVLKGYAGTGKTFLVKRIIEYIVQTHPSHCIAVTAPTNKAVQVLFKNAPLNSKNVKAYLFEDIFDSNSRLVYSTVHKLLGLKEVITETGEQLFRADSHNNSGLDDYKYLIVDEVSMLDDKLCHDIMKFKDKVRIIFMGDPAQIPPIKQADSIPFRADVRYNFVRAELTEIMRQVGDHPIIDTSFVIRNNLRVDQPLPLLQTKLNAKDHGIVVIDNKTEKDKVRPLLEVLFKSAEFEADSDHAKVIAWRNKTVDYLNSIVRELLFGVNPDKYVVGEKLVTRKPIFKKQANNHYDYWKIVYNTSDELVVEDVKIAQVNKREAGHRLALTMYVLQVKAYNYGSGNWVKDTIYIIHDDSKEAYAELLKTVKAKALEPGKGSYWVHYYNILKWSADVMYNYTLTAHKAQGSTYKNVLLIEEDLNANSNIVERNRIKYTSYSRATDKLYVLRLNS